VNQGYLGFAVGASWKPLFREPGLLHVQVTVNVSEGRPNKVEKIEFRWVEEQLGHHFSIRMSFGSWFR
jgi:hypothetical protein